MNTLSNKNLKEKNIKGAFFAAIVGDALCLGTHYEYDAKKIYEAYGQKPIEKFMSPGEKMGGQTHGIGWGGSETIIRVKVLVEQLIMVIIIS